ncbi:hypothetical protein AFA_01755 [Alcaligenes faecalis]|uniref:Uncharacterized protein n=1 Tax=Alcaligenes faecalis TaxID=511 RepID=A0AB33CX86_ALCFA|nr:hypothetical protein AFA_01755 [Alcaligenes faecalis]
MSGFHGLQMIGGFVHALKPRRSAGQLLLAFSMSACLGDDEHLLHRPILILGRGGIGFEVLMPGRFRL